MEWKRRRLCVGVCITSSAWGKEPVKLGGHGKGEMWVSLSEARCAGLTAAIAMAQMVVLEVCCGNMGRSWLIERKI